MNTEKVYHLEPQVSYDKQKRVNETLYLTSMETNNSLNFLRSKEVNNSEEFQSPKAATRPASFQIKKVPVKQLIYGNDSFATLIKGEEKIYMPLSQLNFEKHVYCRNWKRAIVVDWMGDVCSELLLSRKTFHLAITLWDSYLLRNYTLPERSLQLVAATVLYVASKYEEIYSPSVAAFNKATDNAYTTEEILKTEGQVLAQLDYTLSFPTHQDYLSILLVEWDCWVARNPALLATLNWPEPANPPTFRGQSDYSLLNECYALLDLCRFADSHYKWSPRVLAVTVMYVKVVQRLSKSTMEYRDCNLLFNSFLGSDVDICFEGLNFQKDMQPCIGFVSRLLAHPADSLCIPLIGNYRRNMSQYTESNPMWETYLAYQTYNNQYLDFVKKLFRDEEL